MTKLNYEKLNADRRIRNDSNWRCDDEIEHTTAATKPRTRGRNRPGPPSRRYRWKEAIFGRGYPDLCALREGQPYRASQETKLDAGKNKNVRSSRRGTINGGGQ